MRLDRHQQVVESAEHVRADGFALKAAGETREQLLVHRDREVVGPELRQALDPRALGADRLLQARGRLACVHRPQELAELHRSGIGDGRLEARGFLLRLDVAAQLECLRQRLRGGPQLRRLEHRRRAAQLRVQPPARIGADAAELARLGAEPEAIGGDGGTGGGEHGVRVPVAAILTL